MKNVITLDIGGTNIRAALWSLQDNKMSIIKKTKEPTGPSPLEIIKNSISHLLEDCKGEISIVGISVAGIVDTQEGILLTSPNIPKLQGVNFRKVLRDDYGLQCIIENDGNAAAYGEKILGVGREFENFVMFTLGTGIGGGIIINGNLLSVTAEIGHISINSEGAQCPCGNIGCLETTASATAVISRAIAEIERGADSILKATYNGNFYKMNAEDIYRAALEGDTLSRTVLKDAGRNLGIGIANVVNIFSPQAVILTGGLIGAWNIYVEAAIKEASRRALKELINRVKIVPSQLKDDAGLTGIAYIAAKI